MRASLRLLDNACRITLFTRANCGLCDTAKNVLQKVQARRAFDFQQIDVMQPGQEEWQNAYAFDTPVIHVEKANTAACQKVVPAAQKLMHRFSEQQVEDLINKTGGS